MKPSDTSTSPTGGVSFVKIYRIDTMQTQHIFRPAENVWPFHVKQMNFASEVTQQIQSALLDQQLQHQCCGLLEKLN